MTPAVGRIRCLSELGLRPIQAEPAHKGAIMTNEEGTLPGRRSRRFRFGAAVASVALAALGLNLWYGMHPAEHGLVTRSLASERTLPAGLNRTSMVLVHPPLNDAEEYWELADAILHDGEFPSALRSPGYPAFVAAIWTAFGQSLSPVGIVQSILLTCSLLVIVRLGLDLFGWKSRWVCLAAAAAVGLNPEVARMSGVLLSDTTMFLLVPLAFLCCLRLAQRSIGYALPLGVLLALLAYTRSESVLPVIILLGLLLLRSGWRRRVLGGGAIAAIVLVAGVLPWVLHCRSARGYTGMNCALEANLFSRGWHFSSKGTAQPELRELMLDREGPDNQMSFAPVRGFVCGRLIDGVQCDADRAWQIFLARSNPLW
jgi:hypothetical protein